MSSNEIKKSFIAHSSKISVLITFFWETFYAIKCFNWSYLCTFSRSFVINIRLVLIILLFNCIFFRGKVILIFHSFVEKRLNFWKKLINIDWLNLKSLQKLDLFLRFIKTCGKLKWRILLWKNRKCTFFLTLFFYSF